MDVSFLGFPRPKETPRREKLGLWSDAHLTNTVQDTWAVPTPLAPPESISSS